MQGPKIVFTIPIFGGIPITETIVNSWLVIVIVFIICKILTHGLQKVPKGKQVLAEKMVSLVYKLVEETMGKDKLSFAPYIGTLFLYSLFGSLISLTGLRPVTADLNTTLGWALVTFTMIQVGGIKRHGMGGYLKSYIEPVPLMLPLNLVSEVANPISMAFRHFGNVASGVVISSLIYTGLASLSQMVLGWIPLDFVANIPILQAGLPAILSIYFDLFTSFMQAFIFCMLTMVFVSMKMDD